MREKLNFLCLSYFGAVFALFLYSFTQVDLSLTLSKASFLQNIQKSFQYIGFFQRPFSAVIFSIILASLFIFYILFLYFSIKKKISVKYLKFLVTGGFFLLVFSYNAFSYDLFN